MRPGNGTIEPPPAWPRLMWRSTALCRAVASNRSGGTYRRFQPGDLGAKRGEFGLKLFHAVPAGCTRIVARRPVGDEFLHPLFSGYECRPSLEADHRRAFGHIV